MLPICVAIFVFGNWIPATKQFFGIEGRIPVQNFLFGKLDITRHVHLPKLRSKSITSMSPKNEHIILWM